MSFFQRAAKGGGKLRGGENLPRDTSPKTLWTPPPTYMICISKRRIQFVIIRARLDSWDFWSTVLALVSLCFPTLRGSAVTAIGGSLLERGRTDGNHRGQNDYTKNTSQISCSEAMTFELIAKHPACS